MEKEYNSTNIEFERDKIDEARSNRFKISAGLRMVSAGIQAWGGITSNQSPLVVEAA